MATRSQGQHSGLTTIINQTTGKDKVIAFMVRELDKNSRSKGGDISPDQRARYQQILDYYLRKPMMCPRCRNTPLDPLPEVEKQSEKNDDYNAFA